MVANSDTAQLGWVATHIMSYFSYKEFISSE